MPDPSPLSALRARLKQITTYAPLPWGMRLVPNDRQTVEVYSTVNEATLAEWGYAYRSEECLRIAEEDGLAPFFAHAPADLRWCVEEIERLQREVASLRVELEEEIREG